MKKFLLGTVGLVALGMASAPASAADLAARTYTKAPPMIAAVYNWTGFYVGINGGWGQDSDRRVSPVGALVGDYKPNGGTVGGQLGYRWQTGAWVFGVEGQGNWADFSGSTANLGLAGATVRSKLDAFGLATGQIGYTWSNVLLYAKGGLAVTDRNYQFISATNALFSQTGYGTRVGGTVGAGLEFGFAQNWSAGIEYNHIFEGRHNATFTTPAGVATAGVGTGGDTDLVLARLNYKFGFGGPVVAKY